MLKLSKIEIDNVEQNLDFCKTAVTSIIYYLEV